MTFETYPEMNDKIIELLRICSDDPSLLYAAQRIEELEAEVEQLQHELHDEQIRCDEWEKMYNQAIAGTNLRQCKVCKAMIVDPPSALSACLCLTASLPVRTRRQAYSLRQATADRPCPAATRARQQE